jgi:hypothetical protein
VPKPIFFLKKIKLPFSGAKKADEGLSTFVNKKSGSLYREVSAGSGRIFPIFLSP